MSLLRWIFYGPPDPPIPLPSKPRLVKWFGMWYCMGKYLGVGDTPGKAYAAWWLKREMSRPEMMR